MLLLRAKLGFDLLPTATEIGQTGMKSQFQKKGLVPKK